MDSFFDFYDTSGNLVSRELSKNRALLGPAPGHAILDWQPGRSTWVISPAREGVSLSVNGRPLTVGSGVALGHLDIVTVEGLALRFHKVPSVPVLNGIPCDEVVLTHQRVAIGRGELTAGRKAVDTSEHRWDLDYEDLSISKVHAEISFAPEGYVIHDRSKTGTYLNGSAFERRVLVVGDRFNVSDYFFEFTGTTIRRVDQVSGARVEGHSLVLDARNRSETKRILKGIDIEVKSGEFLGVLGGSGHGKSTLMNLLAGLTEPTSGYVLMDGRTAGDRAATLDPIGFVPQDDIVHHELTVREALTFTARLRLAVPDEAIQTLVTGIMRRLGLEAQQNQAIHSLSGGQRKRVNIATELIARPPVLFLDEPTSGLDPANEESVITALQNLRLTGQTVVCTTHGLHKAYLFDRIAFIHNGRLMFQGTTAEARRHFLEMEEVSTESIGPLVKLDRIYGMLAQQADTSQWDRKFAESNFAPFRAGAPPPPRRVVKTEQARKKPALWTILTVLFMTQWRILCADSKNWKSLLTQALAIGLLAGWVGRDDPEFRFFTCLIATLWFGCSNAAQMITRELAIFKRQRVAGLGLHPYILSKAGFLSAISLIQVVLLLIAQAVPVVVGMAFSAAGPGREWHPGTFQGCTMFALAFGLAAVVGVMIGLSLSAHARSTTQASLWVPLVLIPQIMFSGFVVILPEMPTTARWFSYLIPSASAQRLLDAGNIAGRPVPLMTDKTEIPMFWRSEFPKDLRPKGNDRESFEDYAKRREPTRVESKKGGDDFRELDEYSTAWQNLIVDFSSIGKAVPLNMTRDELYKWRKEAGGKDANDDRYVYKRQDVRNGTLLAGTFYTAEDAALGSSFGLTLWIIVAYLVIWVGLIRAEPETLRPQWAKRQRH